jgi:hypothetical protein
LPAGEHQIEINSTELDKGMYFIKVTQNGNNYTIKWLVN